MSFRRRPDDDISMGTAQLSNVQTSVWFTVLCCLSILSVSAASAEPNDDRPAQPVQMHEQNPFLLAAKTTVTVAADKKTAPVKKNTSPKKSSSAFLRIVTQADGYLIQLNGEKIGVSPLSGPWLVTPGRYELKFTGADKQAGTQVVDVKIGEVKSVSWPPVSKTVAERQSDDGLGLKPWTMSDIGAATAASGLVSIGIGAFFGLRSLDLADQASKKLIRETYRRDFNRLSDQAADMALAANIAYGIGAAALVSGLTLAIFGNGGLIAIQADDDEGAVIIGGEF